MRIDSLEIFNFKNIRHLKLDNIPDLVLIAGPNGSGKTSLFEAIRIFKESFGGYSIQSPGSNWVQSLLTRHGPVITTSEEIATISATVTVSQRERELLSLPDEHVGRLLGHVTIKQIRPGTEGTTVDRQIDDTHRLIALFGSSHLGVGGFGVIDHIGPDRRIGDEPVSGIDFSAARLESDYRRLLIESHDKFQGTYQDIALMDYLDKSSQSSQEGSTSYMDGIRAIFAHFLPDVEFLGVFPTVSSGIRILVRSGGTEHEIRGLSSGQREILMTYVHLEKLRPSGSVILFDEPELHLHPTLQRRVIPHLENLLDRGSNQIWVTTHSEEIVGSAPLSSLFAMTGERDEAVQSVADQADRVELLRQLGASVGVQLVSPRILFLEGDSDKDLLPLFFDDLPVGLSLVQTGGKRNLIRSSEVTRKLLNEIIKEGRFYWIKDHDVEDDPSPFDQTGQDHGEYFIIWDRYHIENYLLDEEAIYRVLKAEPGVPAPSSTQAVLDDLRAVADSQKDEVLAMRLQARVNPSLRTRLVLNASEGVNESLQKAGASRLRRTIELLDEAALARLYAEELAKLEDNWDKDWKTLCVGRDILQKYQRLHAPKYGYVVFRNAVARKMRELDRVPQPIIRAIEKVTAGLPLIQRR